MFNRLMLTRNHKKRERHEGDVSQKTHEWQRKEKAKLKTMNNDYSVLIIIDNNDASTHTHTHDVHIVCGVPCGKAAAANNTIEIFDSIVTIEKRLS